MPAMCANVPGQFSHETVSCVVLGIWATSPRRVRRMLPQTRALRTTTAQRPPAQRGGAVLLLRSRGLGRIPNRGYNILAFCGLTLLTTKGSLPHNGTSRGADTQDRKVMEVLPHGQGRSPSLARGGLRDVARRVCSRDGAFGLRQIHEIGRAHV